MTCQFELTEDQRAIQEMARKFTADAITPNAAEWVVSVQSQLVSDRRSCSYDG